MSHEQNTILLEQLQEEVAELQARIAIEHSKGYEGNPFIVFSLENEIQMIEQQIEDLIGD